MAQITNNQIKLIKSLSDKKFRDEYGLFAVEGEKMVGEAIASGFGVEMLFRKDEIGEETMAKISSLSSPSPVLAVLRKPEAVKSEDFHPSNGLFLALDSIRDPGNMGTIIRLADWYGIDSIFAMPDSVDIYNPKVVQATMGAIFRVRFQYADVREIGKAVLDAGGYVYGTFLDGRNMYERNLETGENSPVMIVIGNESRGISDRVAEIVSDRLYIPPYPADDPGSESLNAAIATAVTIAEFRRRIIKK